MLKDYYDYEPYPKYDGVVTDYMLGRTTKEGKMRYKVEKEISLLTIAQAGPKGCDEFNKQYYAFVDFMADFTTDYSLKVGEYINPNSLWSTFIEKDPKRINWLIEKGFLSRVEELKACPFCPSGGRVSVENHNNDYFVFCNYCQARGPLEGLRGRAVGLWNERKP